MEMKYRRIGEDDEAIQRAALFLHLDAPLLSGRSGAAPCKIHVVKEKGRLLACHVKFGL